MKRSVLLLSLGVLLAMPACGNGLLGGDSAGAEGPIRLGMLVPRSGSEAAIAPYMENAATMAVEELNEAGGVLGRSVELLVEDDACDPKTAVAGANKLVASKIDISVGGYCSGATLPTLPVFQRSSVPAIIPAANSNELVDQKLKNVFMINGTGAQQAKAAVRWFDAKGARNVVLMHDNTSAPRDVAVRAEKELAGTGVRATVEVVTPKESDYSANVANVLRAKPDYVYWTGYFQEGGLIIRQLRLAGYRGPIMVGDGSVSTKLVDIAGRELAQGVFATMSQTPETIPGAEDWIRRYEKRFGAKPGPYSNQSYDGVRLAAEALRIAGSTDPVKVIAALEGIDGFQMFSGPLKFTAEHTLASGGFQILVVQDNSFVLADPLD